MEAAQLRDQVNVLRRELATLKADFDRLRTKTFNAATSLQPASPTTPSKAATIDDASLQQMPCTPVSDAGGLMCPEGARCVVARVTR
jgi:hypothetical protein